MFSLKCMSSGQKNNTGITVRSILSGPLGNGRVETAEDEEVAWVLEVVGCKRSHLGDMSEDEFRYLLKPRRRQVALALHPDKQPGGRRGMAETQMNAGMWPGRE